MPPAEPNRGKAKSDKEWDRVLHGTGTAGEVGKGEPQARLQLYSVVMSWAGISGAQTWLLAYCLPT